MAYTENILSEVFNSYYYHIYWANNKEGGIARAKVKMLTMGLFRTSLVIG
jgi:hypothetical protein